MKTQKIIENRKEVNGIIDKEVKKSNRKRENTNKNPSVNNKNNSIFKQNQDHNRKSVSSNKLKNNNLRISQENINSQNNINYDINHTYSKKYNENNNSLKIGQGGLDNNTINKVETVELFEEKDKFICKVNLFN